MTESNISDRIREHSYINLHYKSRTHIAKRNRVSMETILEAVAKIRRIYFPYAGKVFRTSDKSSPLPCMLPHGDFVPR